MKFRKKPVVIEAIEVNEILSHAAANWKCLPKYIVDAYEKGEVMFLTDRVSIKTLEGIMEGLRGDYIIQGVKGELYPCKPDIFKATYEAVT